MTTPSSYLSTRGYGFIKYGNDEFIDGLKEKLTVKPFINPNSPNSGKEICFPVYCESSNKLYIPRCYGLRHFGLPLIDQLYDGNDAPRLVFHGSLRPEQEEPVKSFMNAAEDPLRRGGIISLGCGGGKCLGKDTPVLMFDGTIRMVQDIRVGDLLMGDDSTPRTVLSTCTGREEMFDIVPTKGDKYTVNRSHILSLKYFTKNKENFEKENVIDMSLDDYIDLKKYCYGIDNILFGYRTGVEFPEKDIPFDPYLVGYWLVSLGNKHIPYLYRCNSYNIRIHVLAGIIDSDGALHNGGFDIILDSETLIDDIIYLARSLGFAAYKCECKKEFINRGSYSKKVTYYRTDIRGKGIDNIPTKVHRNKVSLGNQMKDVLATCITPLSIGLGTYYGFEIDGNRRFILGDFTVTHNTVCSLNIACKLGKKTLVVCHKEFLMNQWRERILQFIPDAKVGIIKQSKVVTDGCDIVLASLQSLAMRDYPSITFKGFHLAIIDEIHHTSAEVFSRALPKISFPVMLGLSATLKRSDGLSKVFEWYVGKPVFVSKRKASTMQVYMLPYDSIDQEYCYEAKIWGGKPNTAQMINNITSYLPRNRFILDAIRFVLHDSPGRKTLVLSDRRAHLAELEKMILDENIGTVGYYVGGMKEAELKKSETKDFILGTFTMACIADDTVLVDPITGKEMFIKDFANHVGKPIEKNTPVLVSMYPSTETVHVSYCVNFGYSPKKDCVRIIHEMGDITVSKDHRLYTMDGWKKACDLKETDYLITPQRLDVKSIDIEYVRMHHMWLLGCIIGDMNCENPSDSDVMSIVRKIVEDIHDSDIAHDLCSLCKNQMNRYGENFISTEFMYLPDEKICSIIGGLFDSTGYIDSDNTLFFKTNTMRLANQLRTLLLRIGIRSTRTPCVKPGFPYYIRIVPEDTILFINIVDVRGISRKEMLKRAFLHAHKNIEKIEKNRNPIPKSKWLSSVRIYRIYDIDPNSVNLCDIEIKMHHNFVATGIVVHNSEGMDIPALNTLVLASPVSSIEQSVGRIQRQDEKERTHIPVVIDIWDQFSLFRNQGLRRLQFYKKYKYEIANKLVRDHECTTNRTLSLCNDSNEKRRIIEFVDDDE